MARFRVVEGRTPRCHVVLLHAKLLGDTQVGRRQVPTPRLGTVNIGTILTSLDKDILLGSPGSDRIVSDRSGLR